MSSFLIYYTQESECSKLFIYLHTYWWFLICTVKGVGLGSARRFDFGVGGWVEGFGVKMVILGDEHFAVLSVNRRCPRLEPLSFALASMGACQSSLAIIRVGWYWCTGVVVFVWVVASGRGYGAREGGYVLG